MKNNIVSPKPSLHMVHELLSRLEAAGFNERLAQRVIESKGNDLGKKVVRLIKNHGFESTCSQRRAHKIMGDNFFGVEEAIERFRIKPTQKQLKVLSEIPFSEATLEECKDTHVLAAVFPLSILRVKKISPFSDQNWYSHSLFATQRGKVEWQLVRKGPVNNSTEKNRQEQLVLLGEDEEVPTPQVLVYTIAAYGVMTGRQLFGSNMYLRTSSVGIKAGFFVWGELLIYQDRCDHSGEETGLASAKKKI